MKRILALLIIFCLFALPLHAGVTGSVSLANIRLSLVDGTAFVDFSAAGTLTPYLGYRLILTDSAGKKAIGYIKAAGSGETLGSALNTTNATNSAGYPYDTFDGVSATGFHAVSLATAIKVGGTPAISYIAGTLYKTSFTYTKASGGNVYTVPRLANFYDNIGPTVTRSTSGTYTQYGVVTSTTATGTWAFSTAAAVEFTVSNLSVQQVLTPSSTGVTITSTPGGSTYNWASIEAGFNYNDASGYTYTIVPRFVGGGLGMGIIYGF
jgi:hypothetical protein